MTGSSAHKGPSRTPLLVGGLVAVVVAVVIFRYMSDRDSSTTAPQRESSVSESVEGVSGAAEETPPPEKNSVTKRPAKRSGKRRIPYGVDVSLEDIMAKHSTWNPPRPLRLVVRYGGSRSKTAAREQAEEARRRFEAGEGSYPLIRELSDPPLGIPQKLISQYEDLPPEESSPVIPIENGFVVFFGTPTQRPEAR